jgi:1-deoxy-D-xylulose-5-phosphate reductoisomerase
MKNIVVMGSTGSIGIQSLDVISKNNSHKVIGLTCHSNADLLFEQTKKYSPDFVAIDCKFKSIGVLILKPCL